MKKKKVDCADKVQENGEVIIAKVIPLQEPKVTEVARLRAKISAEKNVRTHVK